MALAFDTASSSSGTGAALSWNHTVSPGGSNSILVVGITLRGNAAVSQIQSVTYGGVALSKKIGTLYTTVLRSELWYLVAPPAGTNTISVVQDPAGSTIIAGATSWTGADQSSPITASGATGGSSTTPSITASSAVGQIVLDNCGVVNTGAVLTVGAGQTQRWNVLGSTGVGAGSSEAGAASVVMSWTINASSIWALVYVSILPAAGPGATDTSAPEVWPIPSRTEPFAIADGYDGELARGLSSIYPHLLAWKVEDGRFIWHDLGWLPAQAQIDAMALGDVPLGSGVDPGLTLFGVESHDSVVLTSLASSALGAGQRRFPDPGGVAGTDSGVLYGSRMEFASPQRLLAIRIWGEDFQQADTIRFAYRWDRRRWYSVGEIHGLPATVQIQDEEGGMFLECVIGFSDKYGWEPSLPVITRIDAQVEPLPEAEARPEADVQIPEAE